jgi:hypothetical protein
MPQFLMYPLSNFKILQMPSRNNHWKHYVLNHPGNNKPQKLLQQLAHINTVKDSTGSFLGLK